MTARKATREVVFEFDESDAASSLEPVVLKLPRKKPIQCATALDGLATIQFTAAMSDSTGAQKVKGVLKFLRRVIPDPAEWEKFEQAIADLNLDVNDLANLAAQLLEEYVARPTKPSSESAGGRKAAGSKSRARSSSAA